MNDSLSEFAHRPENYWTIVVRQFRRNRIAVASLWVVLALFLLALSADFIASDKPLLMRYKGSIYSPVLRDYAVALHLAQWQSEFVNVSFKEFVAEHFSGSDWSVFPPLPFSPNDFDLKAAIRPPSRTHLLGTDEIGRDIASRMIHGSRVSLSVGFVAVGIYVFVGLIIGALAGYYGGIVISPHPG